MKIWKGKKKIMGVFEENKKKRQEYIDKFYTIWDKYCSEHNIHHKNDKTFGLDFNGEEKQYLMDEESLLGYYLEMYKGMEYKIPQKIRDDYPVDTQAPKSYESRALSLFYKTTCSLKESLELNDYISKECGEGDNKYLRFYFRTTNKFKEFEDITNCRNEAKQEVLKRFKDKNLEFDEEEFDEELYITIYGNFYKNNECELCLKCNHYEMEGQKIYNLKEYLNEEDVGAFWNEVKKQVEWKEFVSEKQLSNEETDIEL